MRHQLEIGSRIHYTLDRGVQYQVVADMESVIEVMNDYLLLDGASLREVLTVFEKMYKDEVEVAKQRHIRELKREEAEKKRAIPMFQQIIKWYNKNYGRKK